MAKTHRSKSALRQPAGRAFHLDCLTASRDSQSDRRRGNIWLQMTIRFPPRVNLAQLPTPLQRLDRTSDYLGVEFYLKRDDMTGLELTGNKVRKLEYLLADAVAARADTVMTCGGEQSNHCRATALAAAKLGLQSVLLLRTRDPASPPRATGNILLGKLAGAKMVWISHQEYAQRDQVFAREQKRLESRGRRPYVIPEGGSNALGAWGYVGAAQELRDDLAPLPPKQTTIVHACGSGGTAAGLVLGAKAYDFATHNIRVASINVCDNRDYFQRVISDICRRFVEQYQFPHQIDQQDIVIVDGYVGRGYAKSTPEEMAELSAMVRRDGILFDPVYTGKAFYGLVQELKADRRRFGERIVFVHTGGVFGLFSDALRPTV